MKTCPACPAYIFKINLNFQKQKVSLMIPNEEKKVGIILE